MSLSLILPIDSSPCFGITAWVHFHFYFAVSLRLILVIDSSPYFGFTAWVYFHFCFAVTISYFSNRFVSVFLVHRIYFHCFMAPGLSLNSRLVYLCIRGLLRILSRFMRLSACLKLISVVLDSPELYVGLYSKKWWVLCVKVNHYIFSGLVGLLSISFLRGRGEEGNESLGNFRTRFQSIFKVYKV